MLKIENSCDIVENVWEAPETISSIIVDDNITLDCLRNLHEKYGDVIHLMFDSSTRDSELAKCQNYFDNGIMDVDEVAADRFSRC